MRPWFALIYMPERRHLVSALKAAGDFRAAGLRGDNRMLLLAWAIFIGLGALICAAALSQPILAALGLAVLFFGLGILRHRETVRGLLLHSLGDWGMGEVTSIQYAYHGFRVDYRFPLPSGAWQAGHGWTRAPEDFPGRQLPHVGDPIVIFRHPDNAALSQPMAPGAFDRHCASESRYRDMRDKGLLGPGQPLS